MDTRKQHLPTTSLKHKKRESSHSLVRPTAGMALKPNHNHVDGGGMSLTSVLGGSLPETNSQRSLNFLYGTARMSQEVSKCLENGL